MGLAERKLKKLEDEEWRVVPDTGNRYEISNYGRVRSYITDPVNGRILKCGSVKGFKVVDFKSGEKSRRVCVHKLVAELWLGRPSEQHKYVTHIDNNLNNNHRSNLKWLTEEEMRAHYSVYFKEKYNKPDYKRVVSTSKLTEQDIALLKSMLQRGIRQSTIAKLFKISEMQVTRIKRGENWGHINPLPASAVE
ncbi:MAG: HNH endonuclease [Bacteroidales bacterium]|nr:HNH endonuclease [Bacteroidales bacterium]